MTDEEKNGGGTAAPEEVQPETGCTDRIKSALIEAKPGPSDAAEVTGGLVREALLEAVREGHDLLDAARDAAVGVAQAAAKNAVPMWLAARGTTAGAAMAAHELSRDAQPVVNTATRAMMGQMLSGDGDFGAAAKGAVQGAMWGAELAGQDPATTLRATARVALDTASEVRFAAGERVRHILVNPIDSYETGIE